MGTLQFVVFAQVTNRRVRSVDGDMPCDGKGISRIYKSGSVYVRLNDDSLWVKKVILCVLSSSLAPIWEWQDAKQ